MRTHFTTNSIDRLKRNAKDLRRSNPLLKQSQALDHIAQQNGWPNWALLQRNSVTPRLELTLQPFKLGSRGVFFLKIAIRDTKTCAELERAGGLSFYLPRIPSNWLIRRFTAVRDYKPDPYLSFVHERPRGKFVNGKFLCIVSTNGVQEPEIENEIKKGLMPIGAQLWDAAIAMAETSLTPSPIATNVRLFFSRPGTSDVYQIEEQTFETLEAAKNATLPLRAQPIGISGPEGWCSFSRHLAGRLRSSKDSRQYKG